MLTANVRPIRGFKQTQPHSQAPQLSVCSDPTLRATPPGDEKAKTCLLMSSMQQGGRTAAMHWTLSYSSRSASYHFDTPAHTLAAAAAAAAAEVSTTTSACTAITTVLAH